MGGAREAQAALAQAGGAASAAAAQSTPASTASPIHGMGRNATASSHWPAAAHLCGSSKASLGQLPAVGARLGRRHRRRIRRGDWRAVVLQVRRVQA